MSIKERAKKQIVNIVELIVNIVIVCLAANHACVDCGNNVRSQFVDAVIFGYLIVLFLVVINIFIEGQEFHTYWKAAVAILGAVLFIIAGALVLDYASGYEGFGSNSRNTIITCIGTLCLVLGVIFIVDAFLIFLKK